MQAPPRLVRGWIINDGLRIAVGIERFHGSEITMRLPAPGATSNIWIERARRE
jgi:hypothetical protein